MEMGMAEKWKSEGWMEEEWGHQVHIFVDIFTSFGTEVVRNSSRPQSQNVMQWCGAYPCLLPTTLGFVFFECVLCGLPLVGWGLKTLPCFSRSFDVVYDVC